MSRRTKTKCAPLTVDEARRQIRRRAGVRGTSRFNYMPVIILRDCGRPPCVAWINENTGAIIFKRMRGQGQPRRARKAIVVGFDWLHGKAPALLAPFIAARLVGAGDAPRNDKLSPNIAVNLAAFERKVIAWWLNNRKVA